MLNFDENKAGRDNSENLIMRAYTMSTSIQDTDNKYRNIPSAISEVQEELHDLAYKGSTFAIKKIERWIEKYPNVPLLYNYLSTAYVCNKQSEKGEKINEIGAKRFPEYSLCRINMAVTAITNENLEKAEAILGKNLELSEFLPNREIYHVSEVIQFQEVVVYLCIAKGEFELAENRIKHMKDLIDKFQYPRKKLDIYEKMLKECRESSENENLTPYPESIRKPWVAATKQTPQFNHKEIDWLYQYDFDLPEEKRLLLLSLPRQTLIQDLEKVIDDSMARYYHFFDVEFKDETHSFLFHALWLLAELKATESLPKVLQVFRQDEEWGDYWFSDWLVEIIPMTLHYLVNEDNLPLLTAYMKEPDNHWYARCVPPSAVFILGYHYPEYRNSCATWFDDILTYFLDNRNNPSIVDNMLIDGMVDEYIHLKGIESARPLAKKIFDADLLDDCPDTWEEFEADWLEYSHHVFFKNLENMPAFYQRALKIAQNNVEEDLKFQEDRIERLKEELKQKQLSKMGDLLGQSSLKKSFNTSNVKRNDPCPCGNGRKYKNCHGK